MWLVSCRRQGMLTQGLAPDPKCKLNISSFLTLPHLLDCLICTRNYVSIVLLLWMTRGWDRWGWGGVDSYQGVGTRGGYYLLVCSFFYIYICAFVFWSLMSYLFFKWVEHDSCCVCFFVYYLFSLSPAPLTSSYWGIEIVVSVMYHYLWSQYLIIILWISLEMGECFNLNHSLGCLPYHI